MSLVVLFIALLPAVVVVVIAEKTRSKGAVVVAALIAAAVGFFTGNPTYIFVDLLFVGIATWIAWSITNTPIYRSPEEIAAAQEKARLERIQEQEAEERFEKALAKFFQGAVVVIAIGGFFLWKSLQPSTSQHDANNTAGVRPPAQQALSQPTRPEARPPKPKQAKSSRPSKASQRNAKKPPAAEKSSVEKCLLIPNEQMMVRCLERAQ